MFVRIIILAVVLMLPAPAVHAEDITGKPRVIDGDTIEVGSERVRLHGIDAPETHQTCTSDSREWACGREATFALAYEVGNHWVTCRGDQRDRYGRLIAVCYVGPHDLGERMVRQGWALAYRRYSMDYVDEEAVARREGAGMWRGEFVAPWEWRRGTRTDTSNDNQPDQCVIKGNIGSRGARIYHLPGGQYYERTKIEPSKGERWFCTEAEASAAGWRRSKR
jgi:endonuclease YncB( thermonuclease family)